MNRDVSISPEVVGHLTNQRSVFINFFLLLYYGIRLLFIFEYFDKKRLLITNQLVTKRHNVF